MLENEELDGNTGEKYHKMNYLFVISEP